MLKIGVLGVGHLGKIHLKCLKKLPDIYKIAGFYDPDKGRSQAVREEFGFRSFASTEELIENVDVVDIVTPTLSHYKCAVKALQNFKHILIEKPITETLKQAKELIKLSEKAGVKAQVGHVERYNPAFLSVREYIENPRFIETHRLTKFNPRGTDIPVVLDLMIHDIDILLSVVNSDPKKFSTTGVAVVSDTSDIANARIEFDNGCVANLTSSRISLKNMRKTRIFQRDAYITIDFLEKESEVIRVKEAINDNDSFAMMMDLGNGNKKQIYFKKLEPPETNAIQEELKAFAISVNKNLPVSITLEEGYRALKVAKEILDKINSNLNIIA